jgi:shikimate kinase
MAFEQDRSVIIYGMMLSGKTTLGQELARILGYGFVDLDRVIESSAGQTCAELVASGTFADVQREAVLAYQPEAPTVIATGGSVDMYPELTKHLGGLGLSVFLKVDPFVLQKRANRFPERVAALNNPDNLNFAALYARRIPEYEAVPDIETLEIGQEAPLLTLDRLVNLVEVNLRNPASN